MPYVYERQGRYVCAVKFEDRDVPAQAGFTFSRTYSEWFTPSLRIAFRLFEHCDDKLKSKLTQTFEHWLTPKKKFTSRSLWHSNARTPDRNQVRGALHILNNKYSGLWYEAGTGKTFTAIMAIETLSYYDKVSVVICPAFLVETWVNEIKINAEGTLRTEVVTDGKYNFNVGSNSQVLIVPDSLLTDHVVSQLYDRSDLGVLVIDEWHRFKNDTAARTKCLTERVDFLPNALASGFTNVVAMSGTPSPNFRPIELWTMINTFCPQVFGFMTKVEYGERYCNAFADDFGRRDYNGCNKKMIPELISRLKQSGYLIYCELDDKDVPKAHPDTVIYVKTSQLTEATKQLESQLSLEDILKIGLNQSPKLKHKYNFKLKKDEYVDPSEFMAELRRLSGLEIVPHAVKVLKEHLKSGEPIVVWAWHKDVIAELRKSLSHSYRVAVIDGDVTPSDRQKIVNDFQAGKFDALVCNIVAAGVGYTMTRSYKSFMVEFDYAEGNNDQAIRRVRRKGQKKSVMPYYFVSRNNLSGLMYDAVKLKTKLKKVYQEELRRSLTGK